MSEPRKRQRVPVSCLVCKRRKVKCDKIKPVCGVCTKHGVLHLCEYVDPQWSKETQNEVTVVHKTSDQTEKTIQKQRSEIEDLKRKLALAQQEKLSSDTTKSEVIIADAGATSNGGTLAPSTVAIVPTATPGIPFSSRSNNKNGNLNSIRNSRKITILTKLSPAKNQTIEVEDDIMITLIRNLHREFIDVYCWLNILRIDSQLSNLWFKIVNLQKIYRIHKGSKGLTNGDRSDTPPPPTKCPVMQLDLNLLSLQTPLPVTGMPSVSKKKPQTEKLSVAEEFNRDSAIGLLVLKKIQEMWSSTLKSLREECMNYKQINFLLKYYFEGKRPAADTRDIVKFYKEKLFLLVKRGENDEAILSNAVSGENSNPKQENSRCILFQNLKLRGVYLGIISLIVDETLSILRGYLGEEERKEVGTHEDEEFINTFKALFPSEVALYPLGDKLNKIQDHVQDFLTSYALISLDGGTDDVDFTQRIPYLACCILSLNMSICNFNRSASSVSASTRLILFAAVFPIFIKSLLNCDTLAIWVNPTCITITTEGTTQKRIKDFRIQICLLWKETIRLINIVTFSLVPVVRITDFIGDNVLQLLEKIEESERKHFLTEFIKSVPALISSTSFSSGFLIARIFNILSRAINGITIDTELLKSLTIECGVWIVDETSTTRVIEEQVMLHYIRFFLTFVMMIQGEEDLKAAGEVSDKDAILETNCVNVLTKFFALINYVSKIGANLKNNMTHSKYIIQVVTEIMTRIVPMISGILIRIGDGLHISAENVDKLLTGIEVGFLKAEANTRTELNHKIMHITSKLIDKLKEISFLKDERVNMLSRVWNFYMVFINNIHRISYSNYAAIHANVPAFNQKLKGSCPVKDVGNISKDMIPNVSGGNTPKSGKCPVDHSALAESKDGKCPVDHSQISNSGKCPIDYKSMNMEGYAKSKNGNPTNTKRARKCPFDHESIFTSTKGGSVNPIESHIRGERGLNGKLNSESPPQTSSSMTTTSMPTPVALETGAEQGLSLTSSKLSAFEVPEFLLKSEQDLLPGILNDFADMDFELGLDFNMLHSDFLATDQSIDSLFQ